MAEYAYLTTTGRRTGRPHTIEIWFGEHEGTLYMLSGGGERSDWVRNLRADPRVRIRVGGPRERRADVDGTRPATAREVADPAEDGRARPLLAAKYQGWSPGEAMSEWARTALLIAIDR